jgi:hypothetical protein
MRRRWPSIVAVLALGASAAAQSTTFTYQGRLKSGGEPASGLHDIRFRLFDAAAGGTQLGSTQCVNDVSVADGLFTASIDFGQQFASPDQRFLELQVREDTGLGCGNGAGFVTLTPRQPLTAAPLASHAQAAFALDAADGGPTNAVFVDADGNVGVGTEAPLSKLDVRGGPMAVENIGNQADLLWLNSERSWVFRQEGTGAGTALKLQSIGGGGNKHFIVQTDGLVGIGTTQPLAKLDVRGDIRFGLGAGLKAAGGEENLRLLRGTVNGDGSVNAGSGFGVVYLGEGEYVILFNSAFDGPPSVTATAHIPDGGKPRWAQVRVVLPGSFRIHFIDGGPNDRTDSDFSFCVMGLGL